MSGQTLKELQAKKKEEKEERKKLVSVCSANEALRKGYLSVKRAKFFVWY